MFGGLQLKDSTPSKAADDEGDGTNEASVPAASGVSAFGFMNDSAAVAPAPAPELSSFSFMNPAAPAPESETPPAPADAPPATVTSGFSFMVQDSATATPDPAPETLAAPSINASSGFDFMNATAAPAVSDAPAEPAVSKTVEEAPAAPAPAVASGFSFFSDTKPATPLGLVPPAKPSVPSGETNSVDTPALNTTAAAKTGGLIAGAGVTFGTSSAKPRIKKKKLRAAKIGMGASISDTSATSAPPAPAPPPAAPTPAAAPTEAKSTRDEALEAANRAEKFMEAKSMEEVRSSTEPTSEPTSKTGSPTNLGIESQQSTDEILEAAKLAAENAKILQSQQKGKGGGFMGTFFKGFRAGPNTAGVSSGPMSNNSKHSMSSQSVGSNSSAKTKDRLARKPQQIPEPTLSRSDEDDEDDEVVVTTSVETYEPAAPKPMEYAPVTADVDVVAAPTISERPTFVPAVIPQAPAQKSSFSFIVPTYGEAKPAQPSVEVPVESKPKVANSAKEKFENHQNYFSESVNRAMKKVENTRNLKKGLLEERFVALAKERFASREIDQIEELQQAAIDEEDYEQADELGQKLDAHKREKSEVAAMLVTNKIALEKLESENLSLGELVVSCFEDLALRLNDLKKKEISEGKKDDSEIMAQYESISKQLSAEHERLQQDSKRLERDEELVGEERKEIEDSIKDQTGEIEVEKEEASSNLKEVEEEIEALRKELEEKKKKAADLRTKMYGLEDSISKVRVKFSRQLTRVDKKEMSLKESRREWEIENDQHKRQKDAHDLQVQTHHDTIIAHEELMTTLESELKLSKEFSDIIPSQLGFMEENNGSEGRDDDEGSLAQLKANVVKCEGAIDAVKKELKIASTVLQNLQSERDALVAKIPDLEKEKKAAAAARNFKVAGKFSKEIKDANNRIKECEDELDGEAREKKASAEENLRKLDLELLEAKKVADAEEKIFGEKRMKTLATKISQLVEEKDEKCGDSSSEGKNVKSVAARLLEGQILLLKAEGHELGLKYGGWDELMGSNDLDDADSTNMSKESNANPNESTNDAAEQNDDQQKQEGSIPSEERLAKAKALLAKCSELEAKIQDAADSEDFETATELQESLDKINVEIEELNITDAECELLAEIALPDEEEPPQESTMTEEERLLKIKELLTRSSDLEQKVEEAVEKEDFEAADELQTMLDQITAELTELNVTDEEKEIAASGEEPAASGEIPSVQKAEEETSDGEEEKKEGDKQQASDSDHEDLDNDE